ncbi:MAG: RNA polymerase sigma factor [Flavobacteriaceae bacterium]
MLIKEHDLLRLLKDPVKKNGAFNNLVEQYKEQLYWVIRKVLLNHDDTDDVLQNTFMKIYLNIDNFNQNSKLFTWMYRIAINESINFINKKSKQVGLSNSEYIEEEAKKLESDVYFDGNKAELKLQKTISTLPPKQRMIFSMRYFDEMPFKQISKILSTTEGALRASYHQAVKKIKNELEK